MFGAVVGLVVTSVVGFEPIFSNSGISPSCARAHGDYLEKAPSPTTHHQTHHRLAGRGGR